MPEFLKVQVGTILEYGSKKFVLIEPEHTEQGSYGGGEIVKLDPLTIVWSGTCFGSAVIGLYTVPKIIEGLRRADQMGLVNSHFRYLPDQLEELVGKELDTYKLLKR